MQDVEILDQAGNVGTETWLHEQMGDALHVHRGVAPCYRIYRVQVVDQQERGKGKPVRVLMTVLGQDGTIVNQRIDYLDVVRDLTMRQKTDLSGEVLFELFPEWKYAQTDIDIHPCVFLVSSLRVDDSLHGAARITVGGGPDKALNVWWKWEEREPAPRPDLDKLAEELFDISDGLYDLRARVRYVATRLRDA